MAVSKKKARRNPPVWERIRFPLKFRPEPQRGGARCLTAASVRRELTEGRRQTSEGEAVLGVRSSVFTAGPLRVLTPAPHASDRPVRTAAGSDTFYRSSLRKVCSVCVGFGFPLKILFLGPLSLDKS